jgi:hypothetical protein
LDALIRRLEQARALATLGGEHGGRRALKVALAHPTAHPGNKALPEVREIPPATLSFARVIVAEAPDLVDPVLAGGLPFGRAFQEALRRRKERAGQRPAEPLSGIRNRAGRTWRQA